MVLSLVQEIELAMAAMVAAHPEDLLYRCSIGSRGPVFVIERIRNGGPRPGCRVLVEPSARGVPGVRYERLSDGRQIQPGVLIPAALGDVIPTLRAALEDYLGRASEGLRSAG